MVPLNACYWPRKFWADVQHGSFRETATIAGHGLSTVCLGTATMVERRLLFHWSNIFRVAVGIEIFSLDFLETGLIVAVDL